MQKNTNKEKKQNKLVSFLAEQFPAFFLDNAETDSYVEDTPLGSSYIDNDIINGTRGQDEQPNNRDSLNVKGLPKERSARYTFYQEMSKDPSLSEGIDMHISYALSPDRRTGRSIHLESTSPEWDDMVKVLNNHLIPMINEKISAWTKTMCTYGVNYIRPHAEEGVGIVHFESNYYTMPHFTREYERRGMLAGFTNQHLRDKDNESSVTLAPPWTMIPLKVPFFVPDATIEPVNHLGKLYSLTDDLYFKSVIETQDYGTSFFENSYEPWRDLCDALDSLRASRKNASRIDRMILTQLEGLDPAAAADYIYLISEQLKDAMEESERKHANNQTKPLINNSIIPTMQDGKGNVTIDTQSTDPNIQHIEDILFHLKRLAASIGIDVSMLGWADSMSGGIGEGGYFQTAIQAARRAAWIRVAVENFVNRSIELHIWYRDKKAIPKGNERPWKVVFNSMNTAIEEQENLDRESRVNFATLVASLVDTIQQGATSKSPTLVKLLLNKTIDGDEDILKTIISELSKPVDDGESEGGDLFASLKNDPDVTEKQMIETLLTKLLTMEESHE